MVLLAPVRIKQKNTGHRPNSLMDRKRALGIDFGPKFTGLALSLGGVNTMAMGTLRTGIDWKDLAITITQIASTRRVKDIVIGQPYYIDGSESQISKLVRHFSQILADTTLMMLGGDVTVYLWDERYSTVYAAMRLATRPRFDGALFKRWLDGQKGLNFGAKALLDAESARAILEHWLSKDPTSDTLNKERSERVAPSRQACLMYLRRKKVQPSLPPSRPTEPAGPGMEGWEWSDAHPDSYDVTPEEFERSQELFGEYMAASDRFGDVKHEEQKRREKWAEQKEINRRIKNLEDENGVKSAFQAMTTPGGKDAYKRLKQPQEKWARDRDY